MKIIAQITIITLITIISETLNHLLPFPIPSSIYGIFILFLALKTGLIKLGQIKDTAYFLIEIMPVMFIPAAVGLMNSWGYIKESWIAYISITFISTILVMSVSGLVTQGILRKKVSKK